MAIMKLLLAFGLAATGAQASKLVSTTATGCKPECSVAFVGGRLETWDRYQLGKKAGGIYLGGESYWAAGLANLMEKSGHKVTFYKPQPPAFVLPPEAKKACRIVVDSFHKWTWPRALGQAGLVGQEDAQQTVQQEQQLASTRITSYFDALKESDPELLSRMRVLHWWGGYNGAYSNLTLTPFTSFDGSAVPFPVHAQLLQAPNWKVPANRGRKAFLFGKGQLEQSDKMSDEFCDNYVKALVDAKFEVHTTSIKCKKYPRIKTHGLLSPPEFGKLLGTMAVVIGLGKPPDSPTPFEAMAGGAPFLNPYEDKNNMKMSSQVKFLYEVDEPMVYRYDVHNMSSMVEAAEKAVGKFIPSYIPPGHKEEDVQKLMCNRIFNDAQVKK